MILDYFMIFFGATLGIGCGLLVLLSVLVIFSALFERNTDSNDRY